MSMQLSFSRIIHLINIRIWLFYAQSLFSIWLLKLQHERSVNHNHNILNFTFTFTFSTSCTGTGHGFCLRLTWDKWKLAQFHTKQASEKCYFCFSICEKLINFKLELSQYSAHGILSIRKIHINLHWKIDTPV